MPNWSEVLETINKEQKRGADISASALDAIRRKYLKKLSTYTGRNVIAYYSGWLSKPGLLETAISDEDKNGFMMAVHNLDRSIGLDLILHTEGGDIAATESIIDYIRKMFGKDIRAIVPQLSMSGGTMMACSAKTIIMGTHSNLGPIDPQMRGIPARGVIEEFRRAHKEIRADPAKIAVWQHVIGKYHPTFLSQCENAIKWSAELVYKQLIEVMFDGDRQKKTKATNIVKGLNNYRGNKNHARHIHSDELKSLGMKIEDLEDDGKLQDLVLTVHHSYMHTMMNTGVIKMVENHNGVALCKTHLKPTA